MKHRSLIITGDEKTVTYIQVRFGSPKPCHPLFQHPVSDHFAGGLSVKKDIKIVDGFIGYMPSLMFIPCADLEHTIRGILVYQFEMFKFFRFKMECKCRALRYERGGSNKVSYTRRFAVERHIDYLLPRFKEKMNIRVVVDAAGGAASEITPKLSIVIATMNVGVCRVSLRLPENMSLKGKRQVLRSIISRIRNKFNVSVAEVDDNDIWQLAAIGICYISNNRRHTNEVLSKVVDFVVKSRFEVEILDYGIEIISV